jgi:Fe-S cluster biogenesis protein NfuA
VSNTAIETPIAIDTVPTPNPDAVMLKVPETLVPSGTYEYTAQSDTKDSPLAQLLLKVEGIELLLIAPRFVTLRKHPDSGWPDIIPAAKNTLRDFLSSGDMAVIDAGDKGDGRTLSEIEKKIMKLLDEEIRPAIAMDGGDLTYMGFEDGVVRVQLIGACGTCPSSTMTLKMGIERLLAEEIPEVMSVEAM